MSFSDHFRKHLRSLGVSVPAFTVVTIYSATEVAADLIALADRFGPGATLGEVALTAPATSALIIDLVPVLKTFTLAAIIGIFLGCLLSAGYDTWTLSHFANHNSAIAKVRERGLYRPWMEPLFASAPHLYVAPRGTALA